MMQANADTRRIERELSNLIYRIDKNFLFAGWPIENREGLTFYVGGGTRLETDGAKKLERTMLQGLFGRDVKIVQYNVGNFLEVIRAIYTFEWDSMRVELVYVSCCAQEVFKV